MLYTNGFVHKWNVDSSIWFLRYIFMEKYFRSNMYIFKSNVCFKAEYNIKNIKLGLLFDIYALKKLQLFPKAYLNIKRVIHCLSSDCFGTYSTHLQS